MELTARLVVSARRRARLSARDLAVLAGVSPSLVSRTESGKTVPSADAFRDLLRAAGFTDAGGTLAPLSRPSALWAARWLLGDLDTKPVDADEWVALWARIGLASASASTPAEPVAVAALLFRAGRCAVLPARPGSVPVATSMLGGQIADRLSAARIDYAFTGDEALSRLGSTIIPSWPVAYVASVRDAVAALGVRPILPGERGPRALLVPFDGTSEQGRVQVAGQSFVSPVQAVLDCFGGDGRMVEQAQQVVEAWEEQR